MFICFCAMQLFDNSSTLRHIVLTSFVLLKLMLQTDKRMDGKYGESAHKTLLTHHSMYKRTSLWLMSILNAVG